MAAKQVTLQENPEITILPDGSHLLWNGVITTEVWEYGDKIYRRGDLIKIEGIIGTTTFWSASKPADGDWNVTVWWANHHFRDVTCRRVAGVQKVQTVDTGGKGSRAIKQEAIIRYALENRGNLVTVAEMVKVSGFSIPTVSKFLQSRPDMFQKIKRGTFQILGSKDD